MTKALLFALALAASLAAPATAQTVTPAADAPTDAAAAPEPALQPFVASYEVYRGGHKLGNATLQLVRQPPQRWRVDLIMHGTGLLNLAGVNAEQSTVFDVLGQTYRPLTQATVNKTLFTDEQSVGIYDWLARSAVWQGDIKQSRRDPVALQPGDMSGLLINLAVIRDAQPGKRLNYRYVDTGRVKPHHYVVADENQSITIDGISYSAMRVERIEDDNEQTVIWVANGVPTPIRILQRENGEDTYDLRLVQYRGAP